MRLDLVTPPAIEPVTLDEAKLHLRVEIADDDALIAALIGAAREYCEAALKRSLLPTTWDMYLDSFPNSGGYYNRLIRQEGPSPYWLPSNTGIVNLPRTPVQSVTWVKYTDTAGVVQTVDPSAYVASLGTPGRIQPAFGRVWPIPRPQIDAVQVRFVAGYADVASVPKVVAPAMKLLIGHWYEHREDAVDGAPPTSIPRGVDALLGAAEAGYYG